MPEEDKLRVQIYANLSLALIAAAFTTLAGIVGGFALSAEKLTRGYTFVVLAIVVGACTCLILSIFYGGRGALATHDSIKTNPSSLPDNYDKGNFNNQAIAGLAGIVLGVMVFILMGAGSNKASLAIHSLIQLEDTQNQLSAKVSASMQDMQTKINSLDERVTRFEDAQNQLSAKVSASMQDMQTKINSLEEKLNNLRSVQGFINKPNKGKK
jgi:hypothetical protein